MYVLLFIVVAFVLCCGRYRVSQNFYENALSKKFGEYIFVAFLFIVTLSRYNVGHDYHTYYEVRKYSVNNKKRGAFYA